MTWPNDLPFVWNSLQRGHPPHSGVHNTLQSAMWWGIIKATMIIVVCTSSTLHNVGLLDKDFWPSIWLPVRIPQGALFLNWSLMDHIGYHSASLLPEAPHVHYKSKTEEGDKDKQPLINGCNTGAFLHLVPCDCRNSRICDGRSYNQIWKIGFFLPPRLKKKDF